MSSNFPDLDPFRIPLNHIISATNTFSDLIAQGGFGKVYKGQLPNPDATSSDANIDVAVKRFIVEHGQGNHEFLTEILMLSRYKHPNIATLVGFSEEGGEKIIVYTHEAHGSLEKYIDDKNLTWLQRLRVCLDAARGIDYLHNRVAPDYRVVHHDIKSSNILLDANWKAKISDFGLAKIGIKNPEYTFLVTNPCGTLGYLDLQYINTGVLTKESDVYSFGIVLFEVLCGRLAILLRCEDRSKFLSTLVKDHYAKGNLNEIVFLELEGQMKRNSLEIFSKIAYQCLYDQQKRRPTMGIIVQELETALAQQIGTPTTLWGSSTGGFRWLFLLDCNQKLKKITIDHADFIYSITFTTKYVHDSVESSQKHGGSNGRSNGKIDTIEFDVDEEITGIQLSYRVPTGPDDVLVLVSSMCLLTNKKQHGPYGKVNKDYFSQSWDKGYFAGFYGREGWYLDALGCYLKDSL